MHIQTTPEVISRILSNREVVELLGLSAATVWRLRRRGDFPEPIALSPGRVGWREHDLVAWIDRRQGANR